MMNRDKLSKFYGYIDTGILPIHVFLMCQKMNINVQLESDLVWIPMLYCYFVVKFTKFCSIEALNYMLEYDQISWNADLINKNYTFNSDSHKNNQHSFKTTIFNNNLLKNIQNIKFQTNLYDRYFDLLLEFNRIKRELLFLQLPFRQKQEYTNNLSWYKFYDQNNDIVYYLQPQTNYKKTRLNRITLNLQRKYTVLEKSKFLEFVDVLALIARQDEIIQVQSNTSNSQQIVNPQSTQSTGQAQKLPKLIVNNSSPSVKIIKFDNRIPLSLVDQELKKERLNETTIKRRENLSVLKELKEQEEIQRKKRIERQLEFQRLKNRKSSKSPDMWQSENQNESQEEVEEDEYENNEDIFTNYNQNQDQI